MSGYRIDDVLAEVATGEATWTPIDADSADLARIPTPWQQIATAADPGHRCSRAVALWNPDFIALLPQFTDRFRQELTDVLVFRRQLPGMSENVLVYLAGMASDGSRALWLGWDPAILAPPISPFWGWFPGPVRTFLREVHPGFTAQDWQSYGITRPDSWESFEGYDWFPEESYVEVGARPSELMWFTKDSGQLYYCVNTTRPVGTVNLAYEGSFDPPTDFAAELDELLVRRWADP